MIIATAGHVDHGKTTLVRALTGVDTDRLAEEQRRGMTIEPGFAYATLDAAERLGFVDVPGHERLIRNMLAGVAMIDAALLVVAADDGPMPQTREHLALLQLLGVPRLVVALSKIDRATPDRRATVARAVADLLAGGPWAGAPLFEVDAPADRGVAALRAHLVAMAAATGRAPAAGGFRLAVDRSFTRDGAGRVVTGAVLSGEVRVGDTVVLSPQGGSARVRSLHAMGRPAERARAGQRCALNLAGTELRRAEPQRGDWLVAPELHQPTDRLDVRLSPVPTLADADRPPAGDPAPSVSGSPRSATAGASAGAGLSDAPGGTAGRPCGAAALDPRPAAWPPPLRSGRAVLHLHLGAAVRQARVQWLDPADGLARLQLDQPVAAAWGDRFILREPAAHRTLAGGRVLDTLGPVRGAGRPGRLADLQALDQADPVAALQALLDAAPQGVDLDAFALARNLRLDEAAEVAQATGLHRLDGRPAWGVSSAHWQAWRTRLLEALADTHRDRPDHQGLDEHGLALALGAQPGERRVWRGALAGLVAEGAVQRQGMLYHLPGHRVPLPEAEQRLLERLRVLLPPAGLRPPISGVLARQLDLPLAMLNAQLDALGRRGLLVPVAPNRWYLPETAEQLADEARALADERGDGCVDAAGYRDRTGIGRNLTVEVLEYLDRIGVSRFDGRLHRLKP